MLTVSPRAPSRSAQQMQTLGLCLSLRGWGPPHRPGRRGDAPSVWSAGLLLAPSSRTDQDLGQVSCSCREGYSGDGIRTCVLLDPCSQVRTQPHLISQGKGLRREPGLLAPVRDLGASSEG